MMRILLLVTLFLSLTCSAFAGDVHTLVIQGKLAELQALVAKDPTVVNQPNEQPREKGMTPIFYACAPNKIEMLKYLISVGANVNARDAKGATPLTLRIGADSARILVKAGADINYIPPTQTAAPPLIQAVRSGDVELLRDYLARGADIQVHSYGDGNTALHLAAGSEDGSNIDPATGMWKCGTGPVNGHGAAWTPVEAVLELLLEKGANLEARNALGETPLYKAVERGMLKHVQLLLKHGANANAIDAFGSPIFFAASSPDMLDLLITELHVNPDTPNLLTGMTYLQSLRRGDIDTRRQLLARGASEDGSQVPQRFRDEVREDEIFLAQVQANDLEGVARLLKATPRLLNAYSRGGHTWLEQGNSPLHLAKTAAMAELLCKAGADVNHANFGGYTPLHLAAQRGNLEVVQYLLEHHANPNARTVNYDTPLHAAIFSNTPAMLSLLLKYQANPALRNHMLETPLDKLQQVAHPDPGMLAMLQGAAK